MSANVPPPTYHPGADWHRQRLAVLVRARRERNSLDAARSARTLRTAGRVADGLATAGLRLAFDPADPRVAPTEESDAQLTPAAAARLRDDLRRLAAEAVAWRFPCDEDGRLSPGEAVLLAPYEGEGRQRQGRSLWLAAVGPARRRDEQAVTLVLASFVSDNHPHRWDAARWLWDDRHAEADAATRWGVAGLPTHALATPGGDGDAGLDALRATCARDAATPGERAALCVLLQDVGRAEEALALYGVGVGDEVWDVQQGRPVASAAFRYHLSAVPESWPGVLHEAMRGCAPWRFAATLAAEAKRRAGRQLGAKAAAKPPRLRLFALPNQSWQSKTSLVLAGAGAGGLEPRLELEGTSVNSRLPEVFWKRPDEIDLLRFGLLDRDELAVRTGWTPCGGGA